MEKEHLRTYENQASNKCIISPRPPPPLRFYFVGDEDLLEIIGNSKNVPRLQKHFKKMFAGVHSVLLSEDHTLVLGISAKEGEQVCVCWCGCGCGCGRGCVWV